MTQASGANGSRAAGRHWLGLALVLWLALAHGVLYLVVLPPWQHYDEPTHFEYVRLIAERGRLPDVGDYDLTMRREILASMIQFNFWRDVRAPYRSLLAETQPNIGISELRHPPLYYLVLAIPQRLVMHQPVELQLHVGRATSLLFFLVLVGTAYGLTRDLFPGRSWLPLGVAASVALFPTLTDLCSAVNNDVGAAAVISLLLWGMVRVLRYGWSWRRGAALVALTLAAAATKATALAAAGFAWVAYLGLALIPWRRLGWRLVPLGVLATVGLFFVLDPSGQPAGWYVSSGGALPDHPVRTEATAVAGQHVMTMTAGGERSSMLLQQELPLTRGRALQDQTVTLGVWARVAEPPPPVLVLRLDDGETTHNQRITLSTDWQFHTLRARVPSDAKGVRVAFVLRGEGLPETGAVHLDGAVLLPGEWPVDVSPVYDGPRARSGTWDSEPFENWLRNGSAERAWVALPLWLGSRPGPYGSWSVADIWHSFWEWGRTGWIYRQEAQLLFQSFWGRFAWHHVVLPDAAFRALLVPAVASAVGLGLSWVRRRSAAAGWQRKAAFLLLVVWALGWVTAFARVHPVFVTEKLMLPGARYASVVILPSLLFLALGLLELFPARWRWAGGLVGFAGLVWLDVLALWGTIIPFYYGTR